MYRIQGTVASTPSKICSALDTTWPYAPNHERRRVCNTSGAALVFRGPNRNASERIRCRALPMSQSACYELNHNYVLLVMFLFKYVVYMFCFRCLL